MNRDIVYVNVDQLKHIEDFGRKRVDWLRKKILTEGEWTVPLKVEKDHFLVMDGQHRMEVAKNLLEKCFVEIKQKKLIGIYA